MFEKIFFFFLMMILGILVIVISLARIMIESEKNVLSEISPNFLCGSVSNSF